MHSWGFIAELLGGGTEDIQPVFLGTGLLALARYGTVMAIVEDNQVTLNSSSLSITFSCYDPECTSMEEYKIISMRSRVS